MLKWFIRNRVAVFEKRFDYDMSYAREILAIDLRAFLAFARLTKLGDYRRDVPKPGYWAAKLVAVLAEDCGPCTQLIATMALRDGVDGAVISAVLSHDDSQLPEPVLVAVKFARASIAHDVAADELRDDIVRRWGQRALVALAFAITSGRIYPTLKYALGHGKMCQRVVVDGKPVVVTRAA